MFLNYQSRLEQDKIEHLKANGKYDSMVNREQELILQNLKNPYIWIIKD